MGRLVTTHSTYIEGLIKKLKRIEEDEEIKTITPGRIQRCKSNKERFYIKITTRIAGGYKLIARSGKTVQEIYIITDLNQKSLQEIIGICNLCPKIFK